MKTRRNPTRRIAPHQARNKRRAATIKRLAISRVVTIKLTNLEVLTTKSENVSNVMVEMSRWPASLGQRFFCAYKEELKFAFGCSKAR
jgi:hypothetical protein